MTHVVMFSGGIGSWAAAKRVAAQHGTDHLMLLFADTKTEDDDTYRFLQEAAMNVGAPLITIADGRTIWEVFRDVKFLGNSRVDPCSRILKRDLLDQWLADHFTSEEVIIYVGLDWTEIHRYERLAPRRLPWIYKAPLCESPFLSKTELHQWAKDQGLKQQRLYQMGASHANCGGGCIKMGIGGFTRLYKAWPERFAEWEHNEQRLRDQLGDVAMLKDRTKGDTVPLPLSVLRERIEAGLQPDLFEIGGCGCFVDTPEDTE